MNGLNPFLHSARLGPGEPLVQMTQGQANQVALTYNVQNGDQDISMLLGCKVGEAGLVLGFDGTPLGEISEGHLSDLVGKVIGNYEGEILDEDGDVIGRATITPRRFSYGVGEAVTQDQGDTRARHPPGPVHSFENHVNHNQNEVPVGKKDVAKLENLIKELQTRVDAHERGPKALIGVSAPAHQDSLSSVTAAPKKSSKRSHHSPHRTDDSSNEDSSSDEDEPINSGQGLRIRRMKELNTGYMEPKLKKDDKSSAGDAPSEDVKVKNTLTVVREFDRKDRFWRRRVDIGSPEFADLLTTVSQHEGDVNLVDGVIHFTEPLMDLFYNRKGLSAYVESHTEPNKAVDDAKVVLDYMQREFVDVSRKLDDLESSEPSGLITYPDLWLLYPPGTVVYSLENGEYEAFVVDVVNGMQRRMQGQKKKHGYGRLDLTCWSINYDGEIFGRVWNTHCIAPFHGSREIRSLDLVPEKFLPDAEATRKSLISRGKQFWSLQGQQFKEYTGEMWSETSNEGAVRVMVDHMTYQRRNDWPIIINKKRGPSDAQSKNWRDNRFADRDDYVEFGRTRRRRRGSSCSPPPIPEERDFDPDRDDRNEDEAYRRYRAPRPPLREKSRFNKYDILEPTSEPDDLTLLLCPQVVHGYSLQDKSWRDMNVTQLNPVAFRKNAWERLILDDEYKDILQAMVSSYVDKTAMLDDLIAGKGAGLVALLHGPPGSGKTLTAECVAESFERPLYQVTSGDIGTDASELEDRLEGIFDYAVTWGAILLIDEADIFLQDRDYTNLERNALVSIFLRTLEYFNGILFLTTNRVGTFDQAFQSRIHVTLGLPSLDQERRASVWAIFIEDLRAKKTINEKQCESLLGLVNEKWSKERLNGRQIRNAVRTALVVAEKKGSVVGQREFETVLRISREFEGYMGMLGKGEASVGLEGFQEVEKP